MKKITLAFILLSMGLNAQNFPSPYCDITDDVQVEPITSVVFAGISITNSDETSILVDKTLTSPNVVPGDTFNVEVMGNTFGSFDNNIVVFIDWNLNNILDDEGEIYEIGTLTNSNGTDDISVNADITVPSDAVLGAVRMRITKTYTDENSVAEIDPCAISFDAFGQGIFPGFGQAMDFVLNVGSLGFEEFEVNALSIYPTLTKDMLHLDYKSDLGGLKIYNLLGQEVFAQTNLGSSVTLDLSALKSGAYILKLDTKLVSKNFRFIKE